MLNNTEQIFSQINKANKIALIFNKNWFGDSLAAALATRLFLNQLGKQPDIIADQSANNLFGFLPNFGQIKSEVVDNSLFVISLNTTNIKIDQVKYKDLEQEIQFIIKPQQGAFAPEDVSVKTNAPDYDLIISLGCPDLASLGNIYQQYPNFFYQTPLINIDHQASNENYGQINVINLNAVATCEILFDLFSTHDNSLINEDIATCLLAGIINQTKSFKTNNTTPQALLIVSELMNLGARREEIINHLYRNKNIKTLQLWGKTLTNLQSAVDNKFIWSQLTATDFLQTNTVAEDLSNIIDELIISIPQALVIMLLVQETNQQFKALIYSVKNINSLNLVKEYQPSGSSQLATVTLLTEPDIASQKLIELIISKLTKLNI